MKKKLKVIFITITLLSMVFILAAQYKVNFDINKNPPSDKWGKGKKIATANIRCYPKIQKEGDEYLVLINDNKNLKIIQLDSMGNNLGHKDIPIKDEIINDLSFIRRKSGNYAIFWNCTKLAGNEQNYMELDSKLNKVMENKKIGINESFQVNNELLLSTYDQKIEVLDINTQKTSSLQVNNASFLRGVKIGKDNYLMIFITQEGNIKSCYYKDGNIVGLKDICSLNLSTGQAIMNTTLGVDDKYAYLILSKRTKSGFDTDRYSFQLNNLEKCTRNTMSLPGVDDVRDTLYISNENGQAKFLAEISRTFGMKKEYNDITEFYIKNNQISKGDFLSKSKNLSSYPILYDDIAIYCDYMGEDKNYDVYVTSSREEFKQKNNQVKGYEKTIAFQDTLQGFVYSLVYIIIIGAKWILPSLILIGIISFLEYKMGKKLKKNLFIATCIFTFLIKFQTIYAINYKRFYYYLPKQLSSVWVGFAICLATSFLFYLFAYLSYRDDLDDMPVIKFIPYLLLDSAFTLMVFTPYMI